MSTTAVRETVQNKELDQVVKEVNDLLRIVKPADDILNKVAKAKEDLKQNLPRLVQLVARAKELLPEGQPWNEFVVEQFGIKVEQARRYILIHNERDSLDFNAGLSIKQLFKQADKAAKARKAEAPSTPKEEIKAAIARMNKAKSGIAAKPDIVESDAFKVIEEDNSLTADEMAIERQKDLEDVTNRLQSVLSEIAACKKKLQPHEPALAKDDSGRDAISYLIDAQTAAQTAVDLLS